MDTVPPFFSHCGLEGPGDFSVFREQVEGYCRGISAAASDALPSSRVQHPDPATHHLKACLDAAATKYQMQFRLSQLAVDLAFDDAISVSKAWRLVRAGGKVILRAVRPGLTFAALENCVRDLEKLHPDSSRFLTFMRLSDAPPSAYDSFGWHRGHRGTEVRLSFDPERWRDRQTVCVSQHESTFRPTASQLAAMLDLDHFLRLKREPRIVAGICARANALVAGGSGTGKTVTVGAFAEERSLPLIQLCPPQWLPNGALAKPHTMATLREFVARTDHGLIHLDEVDKLQAWDSDWSRIVRDEVMALLDARLSTFPDWTPDLVDKLRRNYLIVGSGTWQQLFRSARHGIGFTETGSDEHVDVSRQTDICEELMLRFSPNLIFLEPPTETEIAGRIREMHRTLGLPCPTDAALADAARIARETGQNARFLEAYLDRLLRQVPTKRPRKSPQTSLPAHAGAVGL
jgi:hypothetical protein